jgi:hypothetical protein
VVPRGQRLRHPVAVPPTAPGPRSRPRCLTQHRDERDRVTLGHPRTGHAGPRAAAPGGHPLHRGEASSGYSPPRPGARISSSCTTKSRVRPAGPPLSSNRFHELTRSRGETLSAAPRSLRETRIVAFSERLCTIDESQVGLLTYT